MKRKITRKYIQCKEAYLDGFEEGFQRAYHLGEISKQVEYGERFNDVKEPLIKDEEIRKVVRAWAEVNDITKVSHDVCWNAFRCTDFVIAFNYDFDRHDGLEDRKVYTITELCGEEEE